MTIQSAKDQAAQEFGYESWDNITSNASFMSKERRISIKKATDRALEIYAEAKEKEASETIEMLRQSLAQTTANRIFEKENTEKEAYNQGVRDAAESAEIKEIINNGRPPRYKINKESILKLLK